MRISDWSSDVCSSDLSVFGIGGMVTIVYTCSALTQLVGGELADRYSLRGVYATVQWLQIPVILFAMTVIHPALVGVAALMVSLNVAGQPAENSLLAKYTRPQWRGRAFVVKFVLTLCVSSLGVAVIPVIYRSEEHTSELQSLMRISYAVFC